MLIFLLPAVLFSMFIHIFISDWEKLRLEQELDECRLILAKLQRETNLKSVIEDGLKNFLSKAEPFFSQELSNNQLVARLEDIFYKNFSKRVDLLWLDKNQEIVTSQRKIKNKTAWQSFARCLIAPQKIRQLDVKIADNFVKTFTSEFLDHSFFTPTLYEPVKILFKGKPVFLRVIRLPNNASFLSNAIIKFSLSNTKNNWIEKRALKKINRSEYKSGIYRISDQFTYPGSQISENLMHGHSEEFRTGKSWKLNNKKLFVYGHQLDDPDNFLCVSKDIQESSLVTRILNAMLFFAYLPFLFSLMMSIFSFKELPGRFSIQTRFRIATISLTVIPILLLVVVSFLYWAQLNLEFEENVVSTLDHAIDELNESVTVQTLELEDYLKNELPRRLIGNAFNQETAQKAFRLLQPNGCHLAIIISKDGKIFHDTSLAKDVAEPRLSLFTALIKLPLINAQFNYEKIEAQSSIKINDKMNEYHKKKFRYDFYNRLNVIEMGPTTVCLFATFIHNHTNEIVGCAVLGFDYYLMQQSFLKKSLNDFKNHIPRVFFRPRSNLGTFFRPASSLVAEQLYLTALTGNSFTRKFQYKNEQYLSFSRLMKDVPTAVSVVTKVSDNSSSVQFIFIAIIALLSLLAILNSSAILHLLRKVFLQPLIALTTAVKEISAGNYKVELKVDSHDEIGQLKDSFNLMARELETKASMKAYLNEALYKDQSSDRQVKFARIDATIMFCGIRNFSTLEKSLSAQDSFKLMNLFLTVCDSTVKEFDGQTDKFMGETIMAYFHSQNSFEAAKKALNAARAITGKLGIELKQLAEKEKFCFGVGVATGRVIAGHIGSMHKRLDYTVIGDAVNLAARLEKMAGCKGYPEVFTTEDVLKKVGKEFVGESQGKIQVKGKAEPVTVYEVTGQ